jgi:hypothetical protein
VTTISKKRNFGWIIGSNRTAIDGVGRQVETIGAKESCNTDWQQWVTNVVIITLKQYPA